MEHRVRDRLQVLRQGKRPCQAVSILFGFHEQSCQVVGSHDQAWLSCQDDLIFLNRRLNLLRVGEERGQHEPEIFLDRRMCQCVSQNPYGLIGLTLLDFECGPSQPCVGP